MLVVGARSHREVAQPRKVMKLWCRATSLQVEGCGRIVRKHESVAEGVETKVGELH